MTIWEKVSNTIKSKVSSEIIYNKKYLKSIVKLYIIKNMLKLKRDSTQKKTFNVFIYQ